MKRIFLVITVLMISISFYAQDESKVLMYTIGDFYEGETKRGLAHGKGKASGMDRYEGEFRKGFPDGEGTYYWHTGEIYTGNWKKGIKEGYGKLSFKIGEKDSVLEGYFFQDVFYGDKKRPDPDYSVKTNIGVVRYIIQQYDSYDDRIIIKFENEGRHPEEILLQHSSGEYYFEGLDKIIFEGVEYPFTLQISYKIENYFRSNAADCRFKFIINKRGYWMVKLYN